MKVSVVQLGYGDEESPRDRITRVRGLISEEAGQDLVILPELWAATAFGARFWSDRAESLTGPTVRAMQEAARAAEVQLHLGSIIERTEDGRLWNTAVLISATGEITAS
ncbi:MAG: nitrilase-related carbon-nitrogen hydrolase, partial [Angustibacter sp.]